MYTHLKYDHDLLLVPRPATLYVQCTVGLYNFDLFCTLYKPTVAPIPSAHLPRAAPDRPYLLARSQARGAAEHVCEYSIFSRV